MTNIATRAYQLNWVSPVTEAKANIPIVETLKLTDGSTLISGKCITFELAGDNAEFQPSDDSDSNAHCDSSENPKKWSHRTDTLGRAYPVIKPLKDIDSTVIINAYLTDNPTIKAPPLMLTLTSSITIQSIVVKPPTAQQLVNASQEFTATVMGSDGKPYQGATVTFGVDHGASLSKTSGTSDGNGEVTTQVTSGLSGKVTLTATAGSTTDHATVTFVYKEGAIHLTPPHSSVKVNETVALTATLMSAGKPVKHALVTFTATGNARLSSTSGYTDDSGTVTTSVTDSTGEAVRVTAKIDGVSDTVDATFIDVQSVSLKPPTAQQFVNAAQQFTATVMGTDGKPYQGATVTFGVDHGASLSKTSGTSDGNGEVTTQVTSDLSGKVTLTATTGSKTDRATVTFDYKEGSIKLSPRNSSVKVDESVALTATLMSAGKPVKNALVTFTTTGSARLSPTSANTHDSGSVTTSVTDSTGETVTVTAKIDGVSDTVEVSFAAPDYSIAITDAPAMLSEGQSGTIKGKLSSSNGKRTNGITLNVSLDLYLTGPSTTQTGPDGYFSFAIDDVYFDAGSSSHGQHGFGKNHTARTQVSYDGASASCSTILRPGLS